MDVEVEEVAKLLFSDGIPEAWKDNEEFSSYLLHLADYGVEKLSKEASHIREERSAILDQTKELAYSNYKTFIHTADCSRTIFKDFTSVEDHLEALSSSLPGLKKSVETFLNTSRNLSISRHHNSLTLTKHTQLLEILELPQLMDTCVRNGYYDEALEILAYVRRLEKKHADVPIIAGIVKEVQAGTRLMLSQLLAQLRSSLALPQCLKVIGLLRRLDVFTEPELRLKFLQARDSWFKSILKSIPKDDPYHHLTKVVEASRVHLFDIVTQYRAIFSDDDPRFSLGDPDVNQQAIFQGWILHKVNQFLVVVEQDLERGVGTNLESVLVQCMFFGQSFSRVGADFRNLLTPLFQKAALAQCVKDIRSANLKFDESLSSFSLMEAPQMSPSPAFLADIQDKTRPPPALMEFPPLAHYTNGLVAAFNNLRLCCPLAVMCEVIALLEKSLTKVISALLELHRLESGGFTAREEVSFGRLCWVLTNCLLPHVNACLRLLFPMHYISTISGVSQTQLIKDKFGHLNIESLVGPIEHLLPKKEELPEEETEVTNLTETENLAETETTPSVITDGNTDEVAPPTVQFFIGDQEVNVQKSETCSQNEQSSTRNDDIQNSVINGQNSNVQENPIVQSDNQMEKDISDLSEDPSGNEIEVKSTLQEMPNDHEKKSEISSQEVQDFSLQNSIIQRTSNQENGINDVTERLCEAEKDSLTPSSSDEVSLQGQEINKEHTTELVEISLED